MTSVIHYCSIQKQTIISHKTTICNFTECEGCMAYLKRERYTMGLLESLRTGSNKITIDIT